MPQNQKPLPPEEAWLPFEPTAAQPFGRREAAHLFRRAGFAASSSELDEAVKLGPKAAAKKLVAAEEGEFAGKMHTFAQTVLATNNSQTLAAWWLHRMLHTPAPLLEKTTLFWHGHFASSSTRSLTRGSCSTRTSCSVVTLWGSSSQW